MIDFSSANTYTGESNPRNPRPRQVTGPTYEGERLAYEKERDREAIYQRNYDNAMKSTDLGIDNLAIAKLAAGEHLGLLLDDYNKTRAEIIPKSKSGLIAPEDRDMLKQKELAVYAEYKNALTSQKNLETVMSQANQFEDTGENDWDVMQPEIDAFVQKGEPYTRTRVALKPIDVNLAVNDTIKELTRSGTPVENVTLTNPDGTTRTGTARIAPGDEKKIADVIRISVESNDRVLNDVTRKWNRWFETASLEDKQKYLVETDDKPGYTTKLEKDNAILKWLQDDPQVRASAIGFEDYPPSKPKTTTSATPQGAITETNNSNKNFDIQQDVEAYGGIWGTLVNLGSKSFTSDPQTISEYVNLATGERKAVGVATRFEVVSYNPDRDLIIVKIKDNVPGKLREGQVVGLSGANYDKLLRSKPFFIDRTSLMKQYGTVQTTAPKKKLY